ncbi:hypothetical protein [Paracoccus laeviglucosivorans]|uniref:hypothetical protein n=1 Tax=Paracoccus laeviglucosivorans TaxID=1197861 RepID=UPI00115B5486|nr:hypothetical protein [Paracoccus laeviglucosivorans]
MSSITRICISPNSIVARVSVQASEYSEQNGGAEPGIGTLHAVETLFTDGIAARLEWPEHLANRDMAPTGSRKECWSHPPKLTSRHSSNLDNTRASARPGAASPFLTCWRPRPACRIGR